MLKSQLDDKLLDQKNKKMKHIMRLKKLKQEALKGKRLKQSNELGSNANLVEQLMDNDDPFLKNKL